MIGSVTRLRLLELLCERARSINELVRILGVTQQAVLKHLAKLEKNGLVEQVKVNSVPKVRIVYTLSKPLALGYIFRSGILCLYIGSGEYNVNSLSNIQTLKERTFSKKMLKMRIKIVVNRLRTLVEEDLKIQSEIDCVLKELELSPVQIIAFRCLLSPNSNKALEEASKAFGFNMGDNIKHII